MKALNRPTGLIALALVAVAATTLLFAGDASAAATSLIASVGGDGHSWGYLADAVGLVALRAKVTDLEAKAKAKLAEIKDDTPPADVRRFEAEHAEIARQLEAARAEAEKAEGEEDDEEDEEDAEEGRAADTARIRREAQEAERRRIADIQDIGTRVNVKATTIQKAIKDGTTVTAFRKIAIDELAEDQAARGGPRGPGGTHVEPTGPSEDEKRGQAMEIALLHRFDPNGYKADFEKTPQAREFRGMTLLDMAREALEGRGIRTRGLSKLEIADAALSMRSITSQQLAGGNIFMVRTGGLMSTSDFPNVLANVANKTLRDAYEAAPQTFRSIVRVTTVPDFKEVSRVQLGEAPQLERVNEHGEFKRGAMGESAEKYSVATYGKIVGITRQVLVNDDLGAFTRIPRAFGVQAANLESDAVWYQILKNAAMSDTVALFHATHGNLAGSGGAIAVATVGAGRLAMSTQKGLDGKTVLNIEAVQLIVPKALETVAEQFRGQLYPAQTSNVVPDSLRRLGIVAEPRLDLGVTFNGDTVAGSATAWYLGGDPNQIDIIELAYLEGTQGLYTETRMGFDVDGMEVKVRMDLGAKVIDFRGLYKNAGA